MNCGLFRRHLDAFLDGEVDPATQIDFERHAMACSGCQELIELEKALRGRVKDSLRGMAAPAALRERIQQSLREAPAPIPATAPAARADGLVRNGRLRGRYAVGLGVAAAVALGYGYFAGPGMEADETESEITTAGALPMFEDVVRLHSSELPVDVKQEEQVAAFFRGKVDFPVRPARFRGTQAQLLGGRLSNVRERRAAALYYDVGGNRVTMVVFSAPRRMVDEMQPMQVRGRELRYQQVRGYTVPVVFDGNVAYALTGDLDRQRLFQLAASATH
jgi:anti-sigma factor (TIGR02949 family)